MLAGADYLKMGYVSRAHAKDNQHHFVLGTILYRPDDFAKQIDLKVPMELDRVIEKAIDSRVAAD